MWYPGGPVVLQKVLAPRLMAQTPAQGTTCIPRSSVDEVGERIFANWNQLDGWLRRLEDLRRAA